MVAGLLAGGTPVAEAFTPATITTANAPTDPAVTVTVSHTPTNPQPVQGQTVNYTVDFAVNSLVAEPGVGRSMTVTVYADPNAPFNSAPTLADFKWGAGAGAVATGSVGTCSATACTLTITNVPTTGNQTLRFTKAATVATGLPTGTLIMASASAKITSSPTWGITNVSSTAPGQCSGTYTFVQKVEPSGSWLVDMKFGDLSGNGKVVLSPGDRTLRAYGTAGATDTVRFVDASGVDITSTVMANAKYISNDPSSPYYVGLAAGGAGQYANTKWLDSLNWPYDPSTFTGNTWLPAGTTITVTRQVTYLQCYPGTSVANSDWQFGISTEVARAITNVSAAGYDVFAMPGTAAPAACVNSMFVTRSTPNATTDSSVYRYTPGSTPTSLGTTTTLLPITGVTVPHTDASAATDRYPTKVFTLDLSSTNQVLRVFEVGTTKSAQALSVTGWYSSSSVYAMAFAPDGTLWAFSSTGRSGYLTPSQVDSALAGTSVAWNYGKRLYDPTAARNPSGVSDVAFDADGTLYVAYSTGGTDTLIGTVAAGALIGASTENSTLTSQRNLGNIGNVRALAFVGGTMYLGVGSATSGSVETTGLYTIDWKGTFAATALTPASVGYTIPGASDFASCSFPSKTSVSGPAFKVQKSVLNPDGSVAPAGTTGAPSITPNADGTFQVKYLVTVTAVGTTAGTFPNVTDTVTLPAGFTVTGVTLTPPGGTAAAVTSPFTITGSNLDPLGAGGVPISKTFLVTVSAKTNNPTAANWSAIGSCNTTGGGTPGTGVFNSVTMSSDQDGSDNNDACIPVGSAQLALTKQIVDQNGNLITSGNTPPPSDAKFFTLIAGGPTTLTGSSTTSNAVAVSGFVTPGNYTLAEQANTSQAGNPNGEVSGLYRVYASWVCSNSGTGANPVPFNTDGTITITAGMNVSCVIKNTRTPKVHIVKEAATPITGNTHIGQTITPNSDGTFLANYKITVTNTSGFPTSTGEIRDAFTLPAGLLWDTPSKGAISYTATAGTTVNGVPTATAFFTALQANNWPALATSIQNLPNNGAVVFNISVPLKLNLSVSGSSTVYQQYAAALAACESKGSGTNTYTTMTGGGIPNLTSMPNEDLSYSSIAVEDNVACIPVQATTGWAVEKATTDAAAGTTGPNVIATYDSITNSFVATVTYTVKITNTGQLSGTPPAVTDNVTLPVGFNVYALAVSPTITPAPVVPSPASNVASFTIPASTAPVLPGNSVTYTVTLTGQAKNPGGSVWANAGKCDTANGGTATFGGFFNGVTMTGDTDGINNNDACVPVQEPKKAISLQKFGLYCDVTHPTCPLGGSQFDLFLSDPTLPNPVIVDPDGGVTPNATVTNGVPGSVFSSVALSYGKDYWLVETQAAPGHNLLADPVRFKITGNGIMIVTDAGQNNAGVIAVVGDTFTISITDTKVGPLPEAGGKGPAPYAVLGLLLILTGAAYHHRNFRVRGRHAAI